jgi:hypothetical protein
VVVMVPEENSGRCRTSETPPLSRSFVYVRSTNRKRDKEMLQDALRRKL